MSGTQNSMNNFEFELEEEATDHEKTNARDLLKFRLEEEEILKSQ